MIKIEDVYTEYQRIINGFETLFRRFYIDEIDWDERLVMITGARGVGKTTIMLQRIVEAHSDDAKVLYVSMDNLIVSHFKIVEIANYHFQQGGTHLFIDEIHKHDTWSQELKHINDTYRGLKVVASGSSILDILKGQADLSRRAVEYIVKGLSFREYLNIEEGLDLAPLTLQDILTNHIEIAQRITKTVKPGLHFKEYMELGYYPYYLEGRKNYHRKLNNVLNITLEVDLPQLLGVEVSKIQKLKKLIYILTTQAPFTPNISKLSGSLGLDRGTLYKYLNYLQKASIITMIWKKGKSYSIMSKPDKLYLDNTNLFYLTNNTVNIGTLRESFIVSQLSYEHDLRLPPKGDFLVDDKYILEVGEKGKGYKQIADLPDSYVVSDDLLVGSGNKIPVWLFGFLY